MGMRSELVKQVIESISIPRETVIKIVTENAQEDYKLIYEDQDIILWKELGSYRDGKRVIKTVSMF